MKNKKYLLVCVFVVINHMQAHLRRAANGIKNWNAIVHTPKKYVSEIKKSNLAYHAEPKWYGENGRRWYKQFAALYPESNTLVLRSRTFLPIQNPSVDQIKNPPVGHNTVKVIDLNDARNYARYQSYIPVNGNEFADLKKGYADKVVSIMGKGNREGLKLGDKVVMGTWDGRSSYYSKKSLQELGPVSIKLTKEDLKRNNFYEEIEKKTDIERLLQRSNDN